MDQLKPVASGRAQTAITATLALSILLASLGTSIANIALPTLADAFSAPFHEVQAVVVAYLTSLTVAVLAAGWLGDRLGLKAMLVAGLATFAAAALLCAVAPSLWFLVGARALQGIGAAFLMTLSMALMRQTVGEASVGRAMGLLGTASALGTALGPSLGGLLIPLSGWRGIFWAQVPLAVLALGLVVSCLPTAPERAEVSARSPWPTTWRSLASNLIVNLLVAAVMMTTLVVGPFYLGFGLGLGAAEVGLVMTVGPVISIFTGVPSGRLVDVWGSGRVLVAGLGLLAVGAFLLAVLPNAIGVAGYVLSILVLTPGYQLFQAANNTAALVDIPRDRRGIVSGLLGLSRNVGLIVGASAMGTVFALGVGAEDFSRASATAIASGMRLTFLLAGALTVAAIWIAFGYRALSERSDSEGDRHGGVAG